MNIQIDNPTDHFKSASLPARHYPNFNIVIKVGHFTLHFLEMSVAMMVGMPIFFMLRNLIPASSIYAATFVSGTVLFDFIMAVFMAVPMAAWMILRSHGWRHTIEMVVAMLAPMYVIIMLRLFGVNASWFQDVGRSGMFLGMITAMLYRRDHYTGKADHSAHVSHREIS